jgi:recombination protein RecA
MASPNNKFDNFNKYVNGLIAKAGGSFSPSGTEKEPVTFIGTGVPSFDKAIGGGYPKGRLIEIYGNESSCKSLLCMLACMEVLKKDPEALVVYIDTEQTFDPLFATYVGLDPTLVTLIQPTNSEVALNTAYEAVSIGASIVVIDSIAQLVPQSVVESGMDESTRMAETASQLSKFFKKALPKMKETRCTLLVTNQFRATMSTYGNPVGTTGGYSLKYGASLRIKSRIVDKSDTGVTVSVKAEKNKVHTPFKEANFNIIFPTINPETGEVFAGLDAISDLFSTCVENKIIEKKGAWFNYGDVKCQGAETFINKLRSNPDLVSELNLLLSNGDLNND